jgi:hypothetical protein
MGELCQKLLKTIKKIKIMKIEKKVEASLSFSKIKINGKKLTNLKNRKALFFHFIQFAEFCAEETLIHIYQSNEDKINSSNWFEVLSSFNQLNFDEEYKFILKDLKLLDIKPLKNLFDKANKSILLDLLKKLKVNLKEQELPLDVLLKFLNDNALIECFKMTDNLNKSMYDIQIFNKMSNKITKMTKGKK